MSSRTLLLVVLCLGFACVGRAVSAAGADSPPADDEIELLIGTNLPGYWKVDQLTLSDPVDYGNAIEPEWRWRYEALIAPKEPLYVDGGLHGEVVLLQLSLSPESPQTLYGVFIATFHAGSWSGEPRHENRPFDHGGQPASFFEGLTVVVGSPEERELREATRERERKILEDTHKAETADLELEHQHKLTRAKNAHRAALANLKAEHEEERERRETEHQNELARASAQHGEQLASLEVDLKAEAERRRVEITESENLIQLAGQATERFASLDGAEAEMLAAHERVLGVRRGALEKLFKVFDVVTGPDDYLALLDTAEESQLNWLLVATLRHGLASDDPALSLPAWRHLLQADVDDNPDLRNLFTDHIQNLLTDHIQVLSGHPEIIRIVKDTLPSITQWASEVVDFSSQHEHPTRFVRHVLGTPKVTSCERAELQARSNWAPSQKNKGIEYVRVRFAQPVLLPEISVYELFNLGSVRKIILWDIDGKGAEYEVQDPLVGQRQCLGVATFRIDEHTKPVNEVSVVLDTKAVLGWNEMHAISLSGTVLEME